MGNKKSTQMTQTDDVDVRSPAQINVVEDNFGEQEIEIRMMTMQALKLVKLCRNEYESADILVSDDNMKCPLKFMESMKYVANYIMVKRSCISYDQTKPVHTSEFVENKDSLTPVEEASLKQNTTSPNEKHYNQKKKKKSTADRLKIKCKPGVSQNKPYVWPARKSSTTSQNEHNLSECTDQMDDFGIKDHEHVRKQLGSVKAGKKTVSSAPNETHPSAVTTEEVVNDSDEISRYDEYDEHTVPQTLKMKSRQELAIQIQAMKDEVERLWTILTQQHLTHISSNQSASKCPFEFTEHIHDIEIYADGLKKTIDAIQHEKNSYINRLRNVAGSLLTDNNPNITDLKDPNRPTKLAEKLGKMYDDEWTDAVQDLEKKKSKKKEKRHEKIVYHLYSIIKVLYVTCKQKAEEQVGHFLLVKDPSQYQVEALWTEIPVESRKSFTENRKQIAEANIKMLQKIIKDDDIYKKEICSLSPSLDDKILNYLQYSLYFKKCLEICWYFVIQDPPLYLDIRPLEGNLLDKDTHKEYTKSGSTIKYAVWPALYLHCTNNEKGPLLAKGVVQPKARKHIGAISEEDLHQNH